MDAAYLLIIGELGDEGGKLLSGPRALRERIISTAKSTRR
jgi:hypothetical protein